MRFATISVADAGVLALNALDYGILVNGLDSVTFGFVRLIYIFIFVRLY